MKINIRQDPPRPATEQDGIAAPAQSCVWIVGDDGETRETAYLTEGQELTIETAPGSENYTFGPVVQAEPPAEAASTEEPDGSLGGGEVEPGAASVDEPAPGGEGQPVPEEPAS